MTRDRSITHGHQSTEPASRAVADNSPRALAAAASRIGNAAMGQLIARAAAGRGLPPSARHAALVARATGGGCVCGGGGGATRDGDRQPHSAARCSCHDAEQALLRRAVAARRSTERATRMTARATKTVTIDAVKLEGAKRSRSADVRRANRIFAPCDVEFSLNLVDPTAAESDAWLDGDTDVVTSPTCTPTGEEVGLFTAAGDAYPLSGRVRAFYVESISGANFVGYSYQALCGAQTNEMAVISNAGGRRTLAHELGHILLNQGPSAHRSDRHNLLYDDDPGTQLTPAQCAKIKANA